jgi:hypothetical protein
MSITVALNRLIYGSLFVGASAFLLNQSIFVVPGGHRAVIFSRSGGIKLGVVKDEGLNFLIPFWQWPQIFDVRITPQTIKTETPTKGNFFDASRNFYSHLDLQRVNIGLRVLYRPGDNLPMLYKNYGTDYAQRVLPGIGECFDLFVEFRSSRFIVMSSLFTCRSGGAEGGGGAVPPRHAHHAAHTGLQGHPRRPDQTRKGLLHRMTLLGRAFGVLRSHR